MLVLHIGLLYEIRNNRTYHLQSKLVEYFTFKVSRKITKRKIIGRLTPPNAPNDSGLAYGLLFKLTSLLSCGTLCTLGGKTLRGSKY